MRPFRGQKGKADIREKFSPASWNSPVSPLRQNYVSDVLGRFMNARLGKENQQMADLQATSRKWRTFKARSPCCLCSEIPRQIHRKIRNMVVESRLGNSGCFPSILMQQHPFLSHLNHRSFLTFDRIEVVLLGKFEEDTPISEKYPFSAKWPNRPVANPLVAERAFCASEYWGLTRVSEVHGK